MTVYARPGSADALMSYESRYGNFIGGEWVPPVGGRVLREPDTGDRPAVLRDPAIDRGGHREGSRRRARRGHRVGQDGRGRTRGHPQQDRRPHRGQSRVAGAGRGMGQRQADPRDAQRRPAAGRRPFPVLRGRHPRPGGLAVPDRRRHRRLSLPRTPRRGRPDHPVELPDPDGYVEARARAGGGQRRRPQARRADSGVDPVPDVA